MATDNDDSFGLNNTNPTKKTRKVVSINPIYYEWEEILSQAASRKCHRMLIPSAKQKIARVKTLEKIHKEMDHPEDMDRIIRYYCSHAIKNAKTGTPLIIFSPKMLASPAVMGWIIGSMIDDGYINVHSQSSGDQQTATNAPIGFEEILYEDNSDNVIITRIGSLMRVRCGNIGKNYDMSDPRRFAEEPKVFYENDTKKVHISIYRRLITIRIGGKESVRDLSGFDRLD